MPIAGQRYSLDRCVASSTAFPGLDEATCAHQSAKCSCSGGSVEPGEFARAGVGERRSLGRIEQDSFNACARPELPEGVVGACTLAVLNEEPCVAELLKPRSRLNAVGAQ